METPIQAYIDVIFRAEINAATSELSVRNVVDVKSCAAEEPP